MAIPGVFQCLLVNALLACFAHGESCLTTTPEYRNPPKCEYDGQTYEPGEFKPDPCTFCTCENGGTVTCNVMACEAPTCENPIKEPDECCGWCPEESTSCDYDGETYQPGDSFNPDACTFCHCDPDGSGQHYCAIADCFGPQCVDAIYDPTQCCPLCPNGSNCQHGDTVIPSGDTVTFETGETCMCDDMNPWNLEAVCMMTSSTPDVVVESTTLPPPPPPSPSPSPTPFETLPPSQPPTTTTPLSPREARRLEKEARRQARQEAREARKEEREARKAARKAQRAERRGKRSSESLERS